MTTVSVDFEGNESDLVSAFDKVGAASKSMADQVEDSGSEMRNSGAAFDTMSEGADTAETRFTGFYDTLGGTRDALAALGDDSLSTGDKLIALGQAGADLAGGLAGFVIPMVQSLWTKIMGTAVAQGVLTAAQTAWNAVTAVGTVVMHALNAAMKANPILFIVGLILLLVGVFAALWSRSEGFRNFFIGMWNGIKSVVGGVVDFIVAVWNGIPGFFSGIVNGIRTVFSGIGNFIKDVFKGAINFVIDIINAGIWVINKLIDGINLVPGVDIPRIPKIPKLHTGGIVPGMPGEEVLTILQAGERVSTSGQGGGGALRVVGDSNSWLYRMINEGVRTGKIRLDG